MSIFVITETDFQYNDEIYHQEGEGGKPVQAYSTREKAIKAVQDKTAQWIKENEIFDYGYDFDDIISSRKAFAKVLGIDEIEVYEAAKQWNYDKLYDLMKGKEAEIAELLDLKPFVVTEIELTDV